MAAKRNEIVKFCQEILKVKDFQDYCHNGLQVEGKEQVKKIITAVSFSKKLMEKAIEKKADMLIVHHGIFGDQIGNPPVIKGIMKERIKLLLTHDISLLGFHLPLDAQSEFGNNISLCKLLGIRNPKPFDVGFIGTLSRPITFKDFVKMVNEKLATRSYIISAGPEKVRSVAVVSGGSSPDALSAAEMGADTFVSGDVRESIVRAVEEAGINLINAGHYNTEKLGVQNLGQKVAKKFKVEVEFVDIPNEI